MGEQVDAEFHVHPSATPLALVQAAWFWFDVAVQKAEGVVLTWQPVPPFHKHPSSTPVPVLHELKFCDVLEPQ